MKEFAFRRREKFLSSCLRGNSVKTAEDSERKIISIIKINLFFAVLTSREICRRFLVDLLEVFWQGEIFDRWLAKAQPCKRVKATCKKPSKLTSRLSLNERRTSGRCEHEQIFRYFI
jgi:hypothetical protein